MWAVFDDVPNGECTITRPVVLVFAEKGPN